MDALYAALDCPLILVVAGAGYGKTGLLAQFAQTDDFTFSWLTLDEREQDLRLFGEGMVASLRQCYPGFGHQTMQLLTSSSSIEQNISLLARTFVRELTELLNQPMCIVLDDFHVVEASAPVISFVDRLISILPEDAHLIIASRNLPPLQLGVLIAQQQVSSLGQAILRLDKDETRELLASLNSMPPSDINDTAVERAYTASEGWLVGVLMTNHIGRMREAQVGLIPPRAEDLTSDYLMVDVVQDLPASLQEFLYRSSILEELAIPFCVNEMGWSDTEELIAEVERRNLFIQPIGSGAQGDISYRYHPLFREFLVQRLRENEPLRFAQLNLDAGVAYERTGNVELALRHMLAGNWSAELVRVIETNAPTLLQRGRYRTLLDWMARIDALSPQLREDRHVLWQYEILAHMNLGDDAQALTALDRLDNLYQRTGELARRDGLHTQRGLLLWRASKYQEALQSADTVIQSGYPQPVWAQAEAQRIVALCQYELGDLRDALERINQAERLSRSMGRSGYEALARIKLTRAAILDAMGDTAAAQRADSEALILANELHNDALMAEAIVEVAERLLFSGSSDDLSDMVRHGLELADATGNQTIRIYGLSVLALILSRQSQIDEAQQSGAAALALARQITQSTERSSVLFHSLIAQAQILCHGALLQSDSAKRQAQLMQALGLAREATTIAEASKSARLRLHASARLGAVQAAQGDHDLARSTLGKAALVCGQFTNNSAGLVPLTQLLLEWQRTHPDFPRVRMLLEQVQQISTIRSQTYFIAAEGERIWQLYQRIQLASDLTALSALHTSEHPRALLAESVVATQSKPRISLVQYDLRVYGFGQGRVWRSGEQITMAQWGWSIPREMFFYLLTMRQATRNNICAVFWPEEPTSSMQAGFHNAKLAIRKALGKPAMSYVNGTYNIHPDLDYLYDVDTFTSQITAASGLAPEDALELLVEALKLYQDDFLTDFDSEWVVDIRNRLQRTYAECCLKLGGLALQFGVPHRVIELLSEAARRDELNEDIARLLMTLQWRAGKHRSAFDTYVQLQSALRTHLGTTPNTITEQLALLISTGHE